MLYRALLCQHNMGSLGTTLSTLQTMETLQHNEGAGNRLVWLVIQATCMCLISYYCKEQCITRVVRGHTVVLLVVETTGLPQRNYKHLVLKYYKCNNLLQYYYK